jgi:hypothetical protein
MWQLIQQQQTEITNLKSQLNQTETKLEQTEVKVAATADAVEQGAASSEGLAKLASWAEKTSFGGYGEVLYNNGTQRSDNASDATPNKEIDVQRFVLYFAHQFSDDLRFFSELEVEHTNTGGAGEVELEQAYIEWDYAEKHSVLGGLHLPTVGILNETHEPETFYGVERNLIESRIIPSTYRVIGVKGAGEIAPGWSYDVALHEGLQLADNFSIRSSRQSGSRANAEKLAGTARIKYTGIPGLEVAASMQYQSDLTQDGIGNSRLGRTAFGDDQGSISGLMSEAHVVYQQEQGFGLRALYARWDIDNDIEALGGTGRDEQVGWYVEPSWRFNESFGIFTRYEFVDEQAGSGSIDSEKERTLVGFNYWLHPNVVLKADVQFESDEDNGGNDLDGFNLGLGWSF